MDNLHKIDSEKKANAITAKSNAQQMKELEEEGNSVHKYLDDEGFRAFTTMSAENMEKIQSYSIITDILDRNMWITPDKLNELAAEFFFDGIPPIRMEEMVLLGLVDQTQDKYGQVSYRPTVKTTKQRKAVYQEFLQRLEDENSLQKKDHLRFPFDMTFKKQLLAKLDNILGWLTPNELLKVMGFHVVLTEENANKFHQLLDDMVKNEQLERHKDDLFRIMR